MEVNIIGKYKAALTKEIDGSTYRGIPSSLEYEGVMTSPVCYSAVLSFYLYIKYNGFRSELYTN